MTKFEQKHVGQKIYDLIDRFIVTDHNSKVKAALWVLHAHLIDAFEISPFLFVTSAQKKSSKSNLLELINLLCPNSDTVVVQPTPASIYNSITFDKKDGVLPTLCLDEMDRVYERKETAELTGIFDAKFRRGRTVKRAAFENGKRVNERLQTFCAMAMAGIDKGNNHYPDTIMDRAIIINMRRNNKKDPKEQRIGENRFRVRNYEAPCLALRDEIALWAKSRIDLAKKIIPEMPEDWDGRDADRWEELFIPAILLDKGDVTTVSDVTDVTSKTRGVWESYAFKAALNDLEEYDPDSEPEDGPLLLRDIVKVVSASKDYNFVDKTLVPSSWLLRELRNLEEAPWSFLKATKRELSSRQMADILKRHGVKRPNKQGTIRVGETTEKGYDLRLMLDAIAIYCPDIDLPSANPLGNSVTSVTEETSVTGKAVKTTGYNGPIDVRRLFEGKEAARPRTDLSSYGW